MEQPDENISLPVSFVALLTYTAGLNCWTKMNFWESVLKMTTATLLWHLIRSQILARPSWLYSILMGLRKRDWVRGTSRTLEMSSIAIFTLSDLEFICPFWFCYQELSRYFGFDKEVCRFYLYYFFLRRQILRVSTRFTLLKGQFIYLVSPDLPAIVDYS